jgi:peptidoglycan/xylan/chitin deacetylase (PgdA/CDA1 family)
MMSLDQLKGLLRQGHIVGSHTMSHPNMAQIQEEEAREELGESKARLESRLNSPVRHFSYPCPALSPHWNEQTVEQCRAFGYDSAVTTNSGVTFQGDNLLRLKRIHPTKTAAGLRWNLESAFAGRKI